MSIAELRQLPASEKLRIIEVLWEDLSADGTSFISPQWHADELKKTEAEFAAGRIEMIDWNLAKEKLLIQCGFKSAPC